MAVNTPPFNKISPVPQSPKPKLTPISQTDANVFTLQSASAPASNVTSQLSALLGVSSGSNVPISLCTKSNISKPVPALPRMVPSPKPEHKILVNTTLFSPSNLTRVTSPSVSADNSTPTASPFTNHSLSAKADA